MQRIFCAKMSGCIFLMCMSCIVFINLLFLGEQEKSSFYLCRREKKESKNNLVNIPHDFYFLQEDRAFFHLLVHILHTVHLFLKILRKPHHSINWMSRVLHLRSSAWQLSVSTIIHCLCQLSTCLDFYVIQILLVRKENKYVPRKMTQNWLKTWGES